MASSVPSTYPPSTANGSDSSWYRSYEFAQERSPEAVQNLISVVLWLICLVTVIGNVLVISAFVRDRELRLKPANLFILNLSVSDLLIGLISVSFYNVWRHTGDWLVGEVGCKLWNIVDYTATTQSAMAIVLISFDRLMLVSTGLKYRKLISLRLTQLLILTSWVWSFSLNSIPILCSDVFLGPWVDYSMHCDFAIFYMFGYKLTTTIFSFVIPFFCLSIFNIIVYNNIRARSRGFHRTHSGPEGGSSARNNTQNRVTSEYKKHRKAAITLALIVGVFLTCWMPWYVYKLIILIALNEKQSNAVTDAFSYLLWANSAINPFLYAVTHPRIRAGLVACVLCCVPRKCRQKGFRLGFRSHSDGNQAHQANRNRPGTTLGQTACSNVCSNQRSTV